MLAVQKLRTVLRGELRSLIPPEPPDPALDPANTKARDYVIEMLDSMIGYQLPEPPPQKRSATEASAG